LGIIGGLDNRIRGEEFAENRVIEPGAVVAETELVFMVGDGVVRAGRQNDENIG
jgi:hypothetical protein